MSTSSKQRKYEELEVLKQRLGKQVAKIRGELQTIEDQLIAVATTLQLLKGHGHGVATTGPANPYLREFKGLTQVEGLIKLAMDSGNNRFKLREAKEILIDAGLARSKKNANTILSTAIRRSEKFKRVAAGEYEVLPEALPKINPLILKTASGSA